MEADASGMRDAYNYHMHLVKKNTKLVCAYCVLVTTAFGVVARDTNRRAELRLHIAGAEVARPAEPPMPLPIMPLAHSPFPEARPGPIHSGERIAKITKPRSRPSRGQGPLNPVSVLQ